MLGTKPQEKRMGYAADFCRVCREMQPVAIDRLDVAVHFDDIPLEKSQTVGFAAVCQECGLTYCVDPFRFLKLLPAVEESLAVLIDETYPDAYLDHAQRLFLEGDIRRNPRLLNADLRRALVREPFLLLANQTSRAGADAALAAGWVFGGIAAALGGPLGIACLRLVPSQSEPLTMALFLGGLGGIFWGIVADARARRCREPTALLLRALRPLQPTYAELAAALNDDAIGSQPAWRGLRPDRLLRRLRILERAGETPLPMGWLAEA